MATVADPILARLECVRKGQQKGTLRINRRYQMTVDGHKVLLFEVWSTQTYKPGRIHYVTCSFEKGIVWGCSCPDFEKNGLFCPCKHILFVQEEDGWRVRQIEKEVRHG